MKLAELERIQRKLTLSIICGTLIVDTLVLLSYLGVVHWAIWLPPLVGMVGVVVSNAMQYIVAQNKLCEVILGRGGLDPYEVDEHVVVQ